MFLTQPQYSYKQASILCFVNHGPQMLTTSVLLVLFETLSHIFTPDTKKATILAFLGAPRLAQNGQFGIFATKAKLLGPGYTISCRKGFECFLRT